MEKSRAEKKADAIGISCLTFNEIRSIVLNSQHGSETVDQDAQAKALSFDQFERRQNGVYEIKDMQSFTFDLYDAWNTQDNVVPITIRGCSNFQITCSKRIDFIRDDWDFKRLLLIDKCKDFHLHDIKIQGSRNPITINRCKKFKVEEITIKNSRGYGLSILRSEAGSILKNNFINCLASGINIVGQAKDIYINECTIMGCQGLYNWDAGINCMHCTPKITLKEIPETSHEASDLTEKIDTPHRIIIENTQIYFCQSQGIYLEGAAQVAINNCNIRDNNKEGICFDWGTMYCHLVNSQISRNGERKNYDKLKCDIDFVPSSYIDHEERHYCQLPGISIDNGLMNSIEHNEITGNYGGGIKLVRSAIRNIIRFNTIAGNINKLQLFNESTYEFDKNPYWINEIKILNMGPGNLNEFDANKAHLDFIKPYGNTIYGNNFHASLRQSANLISMWDKAEVLKNNNILM